VNVAYLVPSYGRVSETFVNDLVRGLSERVESLSVVTNDVVGKSPGPTPVKEVPFLALRSIADRLRYRVAEFFGRNRRQHQLLMRHANRQLRPALRRIDPDVAYIDFGRAAVAARAPLQASGIPFAVHFHGADVTSHLNDPAYRAALHKVFRDADALVVASHHVRRLLVLEGAPPEKIRVVRLGVNLEGVEPLSWEKRKETGPSIVFLGRMTPKKHPTALVEAFRLVKEEVPQATLTLIGDGPERSRVARRISRHGLQDHVTMTGALPRQEALSIVRKHWVYAQHSVTTRSGDQEGFGISLSEAAMLELPVVSTLHDGIPEQVQDGKTGYLVREHDYEAMAERLEILLKAPKNVQEMGKKAKKKIHLSVSDKKRAEVIKNKLVEICR
jgi:colanic acid/amylovoran biosynthesis glycosyltransferase